MQLQLFFNSVVAKKCFFAVAITIFYNVPANIFSQSGGQIFCSQCDRHLFYSAVTNICFYSAVVKSFWRYGEQHFLTVLCQQSFHSAMTTRFLAVCDGEQFLRTDGNRVVWCGVYMESHGSYCQKFFPCRPSGAFHRAHTPPPSPPPWSMI